MSKFSIKEYQNQVDEVLIRHRSILDILTKLHESSGKVSRSVAKTATYCGCVRIVVEKQFPPEDLLYSQLKDYMGDHVEGELCDICKEKIEAELANNLFYLTTICNLFGLDMEQLLIKHHQQIKTLGKFGLL